MIIRAYKSSDSSEIENLFVSVFSKSEGEREGTLIGNLARELIESTDSRDLFGFVAVEDGQVVGVIFFSRMFFDTKVDVFILAPVAVHSSYQRMGIGQALITHGLQVLREGGIRIVTTYGDPAYYVKVGFEPLSQTTIKAPFKLSQPHGWLGQSLTGDSIEPIPGPCTCVKAFDNPLYW